MTKGFPPCRICPECEGQIEYRHWPDYYTARKKNSVCKSCSTKLSASNRDYRGARNPFWGKRHTVETIRRIVNHPVRATEAYRRSMSRNTVGDKNPMYGRTVYDRWLEKYGKVEADRRRDEKFSKVSRQCSGTRNPMYGKPPPRGSGGGWSGWYKGWYFRSLRELSYVVGVLEKEGRSWVSAETRDLSVDYVDGEGHARTYRADFMVDGKRLVEVKPKRLMGLSINVVKRVAAMAFCKVRGYEYVVEDAELLMNDELVRMWRDKVIVFTEKWDRIFKERYAV